MATWQERAQRGLTLFEAGSSNEGDRTWQIFNHIPDENNFSRRQAQKSKIPLTTHL